MKHLLTSAIVLGAVFTLGAIQQAGATTLQPASPTVHENQIVQARWHGYRYYDGGPDYYYYPGPYYEDPGFSFHLRLD